MYHVIVMKHIAKNEDEDNFEGKQFYYHLSLPFPPYVGLTISTSGWFSGTIESVDWTQNELSGQKYFTCRVTGEKPFYSNGDYFSYEGLCETALQRFWKPYTREAIGLINKITIVDRNLPQ
ncbi:hypothetical protein [uncultured Shewanella sp.]|uniref:hypothetical protein n=1 Tax=uncultured Shewanella sp. TaxID=173975 RepID=UPI00260B7006|nr:hypothetical protein [uncultured Shewanella sp.]